MKSFSIPATQAGDYMVRAYSGGIADPIELSNLASGLYGPNAKLLWKLAAAQNALRGIVTRLNATGVIPAGDFLNCMLGKFAEDGVLVSEANTLDISALSDRYSYRNAFAAISASLGVTATAQIGYAEQMPPWLATWGP